MTRDDILRSTYANFDTYYDVWNENMGRRGMGALVFISREHDTPTDEITLVYFTLKQLREYLGMIRGDYGFVYRWIKHAESVRGIPVVILPPIQPSLKDVPSAFANTPESDRRD